MNHTQPITLQPTGIPSFDEILHGGIPNGSTVLVAGPSGAGKTMFCMHWLFAGMSRFNEPGLYISLTEPISKLLNHQSANSFFDQSLIDNQSIQFKDLRILLEYEKLDTGPISKDDIVKIVDSISKMVLEAGAKRVILDSVTALCYRLESPDLIRHFIFTLGTTLAYLDVTVLLTSEVSGEGVSIFGVEEFISDGIFKFDYNSQGQRIFRIIKLRGQQYNSEAIKFSITENGLQLYPLIRGSLSSNISSDRVQTGIAGLDEMLFGGFITGSCIEIKGPSGSGKTIITHHCIEKSLQDGKKVLHVSFEQSVAEIQSIVQSFGWQHEAYEASQQLHVTSLIPEDHYIQAHVCHLEQAITLHQYNVVVLDSLYALAKHFPSQELYESLKRFIIFCKNNGVTLLLTNSANSFMDTGASGEENFTIAGLADTIIHLRFVEIDSELRHGILVIKMRNSEHTKRLMELCFTSHGIVITDGFNGYENVMSGTAHKVSSSESDKLYSLFLEEFGAEGEALFNEQKQIGLQYDQVHSFIESLVVAQIMTSEQENSFMQRVKEIM